MVGRACRSRRSFTHEIRPARGSKGPLLGEGGENGTQILSPARYDCFSRRAYGVVLKKKINRIFKKSYPSFTPLCWHVVRCSHRSLRGEILTASPPEPPPPPDGTDGAAGRPPPLLCRHKEGAAPRVSAVFGTGCRELVACQVLSASSFQALLVISSP